MFEYVYLSFDFIKLHLDDLFLIFLLLHLMKMLSLLSGIINLDISGTKKNE